MIEDELLQNDEIVDEINGKYELKKNERINPERYMNWVQYCSLTDEECEGDDCSTCHVAREEAVGDVRGDILGRYPIIKKELDGVEYFVNWSNSVMEIKSSLDLMKMEKFTWVEKLEHVDDLSDEILEKYEHWTTIKKVCLQNDEIVEYWHGEDYPLVIVCKNATYIVAPTIVW